MKSLSQAVRVCLGVTGAFVTMVMPRAQQPAQAPPIFRGGTTVVPLTVTVLDKKGNPVTDLTQLDFTVFENDVRQDLRSFFPQPMTPQRPTTDPGSAVVRGATAPGVAPATRRTFLLVLGPGRIQVPAKALDGAITFVRGKLLPQDLVAVFAFDRASEFTTDHEQTARMLERYRKEHERIFLDIREFRFRHPRTDLPESLQRRMHAVFDGLPTRSATDLLMGMDGLKSLNEPGWNRQETMAEVLERTARVPMRLSEQMLFSQTLKVYAGISHLRLVDGQKHLVWLGRQLETRSVDEDRRIAARANDARVIIDIIHTTGVGADGWPGSAANMSEWTGGYFTRVAYADAALGRVDARGRFSYLLGYTPTNLTLDGTYRQIDVKVNRPDVTVVFQHGYYATGEVSPVALRDLLTDSRLAAAGAADQAADGLDVNATASLISVFGRNEMRVDLTIDVAKLSFTTTPDGRTATVDVQIFCGDAKQQVVGDLRKRFDVTLDDETYRRVLRERLPISVRVPVTAPVKYVKVAVYDYAADLLGTTSLTIK
jgi:VWFA-related protein